MGNTGLAREWSPNIVKRFEGLAVLIFWRWISVEMIDDEAEETGYEIIPNPEDGGHHARSYDARPFRRFFKSSIIISTLAKYG